MKTKIDVISGFLGAGKTTLIKKIIQGMPSKEDIAIVENEFGDIGIDGDILKSCNINVREISGGCICCSLHGNFIAAVTELVNEYAPQRIIIEPTGIGKLSDVLDALKSAGKKVDIEFNIIAAVVDPLKFQILNNMFGAFFHNQIATAQTIFLSKAQFADENTIMDVTKKIRAINPVATIVTAPWQDLPDTDILKIAEDDRIDKILDLTNYTYKYSKNDPISQISSLCFCPKKPHTKKEFRALLEKIATNKELGLLLRSKGFFSTPENKFIQFDYTPGAIKFTTSHTDAEDKIIIIGKNLNKPAIDKYFC